jgi:hypothetical protein
VPDGGCPLRLPQVGCLVCQKSVSGAPLGRATARGWVSGVPPARARDGQRVGVWCASRARDGQKVGVWCASRACQTVGDWCTPHTRRWVSGAPPARLRPEGVCLVCLKVDVWCARRWVSGAPPGRAMARRWVSGVPSVVPESGCPVRLPGARRPEGGCLVCMEGGCLVWMKVSVWFASGIRPTRDVAVVEIHERTSWALRTQRLCWSGLEVC